MIFSRLVQLLGGSKKASERLGVSQRTVQRWAKGTQQPSKKNMPTAQRLWREVTAEQWSDEEKELFDNLTVRSSDARGDEQLQELFDEAFFRRGVSRDDRNSAYMALNAYLEDEYDIDFDSTFEWESYQEWYDSQASAAAA